MARGSKAKAEVAAQTVVPEAKTEYHEHMGKFESKEEKKASIKKPSKEEIDLTKHPKFDKFK